MRSFLWEPASPEPFSDEQFTVCLNQPVVSVQVCPAVWCWSYWCWPGAHPRGTRCAFRVRSSASGAPRSSETCWRTSRRCREAWVQLFSPLCLKKKIHPGVAFMLCLFWQNVLCYGILSSGMLMTSNSDTPLACAPNGTQVTFDDAFTSVARAAATFQRNILVPQVSKYVFKDVFYRTEHKMPGAEKLILQWGLFISKYSKNTETVFGRCVWFEINQMRI